MDYHVAAVAVRRLDGVDLDVGLLVVGRDAGLAELHGAKTSNRL